MTATTWIASHRRSLSDGGQSTKAWKVLSQTLPSCGPDADAWWQLTGRHLALLIDAAEYPIEKQYECLLYHYHYAAPCLGPAPREGSSSPAWKSMLQLDGTPFEFSWKWNTPDGEPEVRFGLEPIGPMAGTAFDPMNHLATHEVLHKLSAAVPGADLTWTHHFLATLFDHDYAKYTQKAANSGPLGTSLIYSLEFQRDSTALKTYFQPCTLDQQGFVDIPRWEASFRGLHPSVPSRTAMHEFLKKSLEGKLLKPFCLSVDNCDPAKGRIKWYFNSPHTNFNAIREVMTLGGRIANTKTREKQFKDLFDLLKTLTEQPGDFPTSSEFPYVPTNGDTVIPNFADVPEMLRGLVYYFDIAPGRDLPAIKIYFPVRNHCRNDLAATQNLNRWLESRGRWQYGAAFLRALEGIADYRRLDDGGGLLTFLSCQLMEDGELDLTSYVNPQAFHSGRIMSRRSTRRRGDDGW